MNTAWVESAGIKCLPLAAVHTNNAIFHGAGGLFSICSSLSVFHCAFGLQLMMTTFIIPYTTGPGTGQ